MQIRGGECELEWFEPISPRAPLNDHLVVIPSHCVYRFARGPLLLRVIAA